MRAELIREKRARVGALRQVTSSESAKSRAEERATKAVLKYDRVRTRHTRMMSRDHIAVGGKVMRLHLMPNSHGREEYSAVPMVADVAEGDDSAADDANAAAPEQSWQLCSLPRRKVKCHEVVVSITREPAAVGHEGHASRSTEQGSGSRRRRLQ